MTRTKLKASLAGALLLGASAATAADQWSTYFIIDYLDNERSGAGSDSLAVKRDSGSHPNPAGCANTTYAYPVSSTTSASRKVMTRTLLAAYFSGKPVRLRIDDGQCVQSSPAYYAVAMDNDE
jgi:hypothetical protein